ncbi:MAG: UDP-2,3-diacylglucosamine diphosphatase [Roseinatronobacter sp.]
MPFDATKSYRPLRTLFLSDLHLGALGARADLALAFLKHCPADRYVLVGDILDLWQPLLPHWTRADQAVIDFLNARARAGAHLIYVRGNHDPNPLLIPDHARLTARHVQEYIHESADGGRFLVTHGDQVDSRLIRTHTMTRLGSLIDHSLRWLDRRLRRAMDTKPDTRTRIEGWLLAFNALMYRGREHERSMVEMARARGLDGVICGHFHIAGLHRHFGLTYANCGDWMDSMTAIEDPGTGRLRLLGGREAMLAHAPLRGPTPEFPSESPVTP